MDTKRAFGYGSIILAGVGVFTVIAGFRMFRKANKAIETVNKAVDDLADKTPSQLSKEIVEKAAEKIADRAASEGIEKAREDISLRVRTTIYSIYDDIEQDVKERLEKAVERDIDMDELKKSVENKASSAVVSKFVENLSDYAGPIMTGIMSAVKRKEKQLWD